MFYALSSAVEVFLNSPANFFNSLDALRARLCAALAVLAF
jgi:hypothetical protein